MFEILLGGIAFFLSICCVGIIFCIFYLRKTLRRLSLMEKKSKKQDAEIKKQNEEIKARDAVRDAMIKDGFQGHVEASKRTLEFIKAGFDAEVGLANQVIEASAKHSESVIKMDTDNSQKIFDTVVLTTRMLDLILQGLGYQPKGPNIAGLQDVPPGANYNRPPAPKEEEGLTYLKQ